jgi:dihydroorotate dehydrogenase electron transfer subunit
MSIIMDQSLEVTLNRPVAADTLLMGLRSLEMAASAKPGHFVMVRLGRALDPLLRRPFSIAGVVKGDEILILYRVVGRGTRIMAELKAGQRLRVMGPLGREFRLPVAEQMPLIIGGGMGVAPLFFLAQVLRGRQMHFMAGFGGADKIVEAAMLGCEGLNISLATDDGTLGHAGPVTELLGQTLENLGGGIASCGVFACGPSAMLKRVAQTALKYRVPCQVSLEAAMACGVGACQGCALRASRGGDPAYYHVCKDGPVFPAEAIDWNVLNDPR